MRIHTRYTLDRVRTRKRLALVGLLVVMIGGAISTGSLA
jgi:hypothetical protein